MGSVRVGFAVCDPGGILATPVATLARDEADGADQQQIVDYVREHDALEVVVGLPRSLSGHEGAAAALARAYARELHRRLGGRTPVRLVDERLTTVDAQRRLRASRVAGRQQRSRIDQAAAVLILQTALDAERVSGQPAGERVGARRPRSRTARTDTAGTKGQDR